MFHLPWLRLLLLPDPAYPPPSAPFSHFLLTITYHLFGWYSHHIATHQHQSSFPFTHACLCTFTHRSLFPIALILLTPRLPNPTVCHCSFLIMKHGL
ncbi:hypothetical protein CC80DRAFT_234938 [Byssothecium circinans]|uniref:Secreted protein n=1 Tax=Byssothecium circinans TaxID=147558 RepID=A0A6A5UBG6_9PLEO|nr:hypothetical protein CC80DRAFT_234938 [Byssothecium circinans]